jgi:hypothetical protein
VRFIERAGQRTAAVTAGAEAHELLRIINIWTTLVVSLDNATDIDQDFGRRGFSRQGMNRHSRFLSSRNAKPPWSTFLYTG